MTGDRETGVFRYYDAPEAYPARSDGARIAMVPEGYTNTRALLTEVGRLLAFPPYFGKNLDAFWDCVTDPDVMAPGEVLLVHADLPALPGRKRCAYIEVLRDAVLYWREQDPERRFEVWFPGSVRDDVDAALDALPPPS